MRSIGYVLYAPPPIARCPTFRLARRCYTALQMIHWARDHLRRRGLLVDEYRMWSVVPAAKDALIEDLQKRGATSR
jgi:hypothetical protein